MHNISSGLVTSLGGTISHSDSKETLWQYIFYHFNTILRMRKKIIVNSIVPFMHLILRSFYVLLFLCRNRENIVKIDLSWVFAGAFLPQHPEYFLHDKSNQTTDFTACWAYKLWVLLYKKMCCAHCACAKNPIPYIRIFWHS